MKQFHLFIYGYQMDAVSYGFGRVLEKTAQD
jgi:hypothetical protein